MFGYLVRFGIDLLIVSPDRIKRNRRLLLDSTIFDLQPDGGISRYWYELVSNLAVRNVDWELTLFADTNTSNKFGRRLLELTKDKPHVRVHQYGASQLGRLYGPRLSNEFSGLLWHSSYYRVPSRERLPAVCTVHDFIYERYFSGPYAWLHNWKKGKAILDAREIICVSEATKRELFSFYPHVEDDRCHVIHHGLSAAFRPADGPPARVEFSTPYVLFVGSRASYKNFQLSVLAVETLPDVELFIVGGGGLSRSEQTLLRTKIPKRHRIFESPSDEVLRTLYQGAIALTYLSRCEGFGFPPLEAMACGCPVIALNASSIPEIAGDAAILLRTANVREVAEAIRSTFTHELRAVLVERGIKRAAKFSWDRTVDKTVEIYEKAIS